MTDGWRVAAASVVGAGHLAADLPCQDHHAVARVPGGIVAVAADGAGSASRAEEGARRACASFVGMVRAAVEAGGLPDEGEVRRWAAAFQAELVIVAAGERPRDYACTLLAAVLLEEEALFVQHGDGAIVVREGEGAFAEVWWPEPGEYANLTTFLTDADAPERLLVARVARRYDEAALFTDGLQRLVLDLAGRAVHQPFFEQVMAPVRREGPTDAHLSERLAAWLGSEKVNARTDDDKTLVLLRRVAAAG